MDAVKFLDMFPCCKALAAVAGGLDAAEVRSVLVNRQEQVVPGDWEKRYISV